MPNNAIDRSLHPRHASCVRTCRAGVPTRSLLTFGFRVRHESIDSRERNRQHSAMTSKQFFDWQTSGGTNDVMRLVDCLERADILWCAIGGVAVNHWATEPMVTQDVDLVVATDSVAKAVSALEAEGFRSETHEWSINLKGQSKVTIQISTEASYSEFPGRSVPADVHGILMRVASLEDTLTGKMRAWADPTRRQSKRIKDLGDIARLVETHPTLWSQLTDELRSQLKPPQSP
jgi:hypothetical protein